ncbi:MAG: Vitamin B12 import ATP-binding protein BtuD [Bacteroidia bacterium]|nr:Vitamin B12 import ATP-binding protein BtuD [Bacteroidia bacterium]
MEIFKAENITKRYATHLALDNVSISVRANSIFGLLGPNGAGKTTLIRMITQITAPDSGNLYFHGQKLVPADSAKIGYLPEERGLYKKMEVGEQALYLAQLKGLSRKEALTKLKYWFEKFEIQSWWKKKVEELSKGMAQKVQFIVTILHEPELLILDEPFSGFDPINTNLIKEEILRLKKNGTTIIFSTHNMGSVEELCDDIALINQSKKILDGSVSDIRTAYKKNIWEVEYHSPSGTAPLLAPEYELLETHEKDSHKTARIKVGQHTSNELLAALIPQVSILSFKEEIPAMNDIFISKVNEMNNQQTEKP